MRLIFIERHSQIAVDHLRRHGFGEYFFEGSHGLSGAVTGSSGPVDLRGAVFVEAHGEFRSWPRFKSSERRERHHLVLIVSYEELADILSPVAVVALGLNVDLPLPAKAVEVINEQAAHESLYRPVDIADGHTLLDDFVAVHIDELLRYVRQERRAQTGNFRALPRCG